MRLSFFLFVLLPFLVLPGILPAQHAPFIENKGQWPSHVLFRAEFTGGSLWLEKEGFTWQFTDLEQLEAHHKLMADSGISNLPPQLPLNMSSVKVRFADQAEVKSVRGEGAYDKGNYHFLQGNNPEKWGRDAEGYTSALLQDIWPGIDMRWYWKAGNLKYDFVIEGGEPRSIGLIFEGHEGLEIGSQGELRVQHALGDWTEAAPVSFLVEGSEQLSVASSYRLENSHLSIELESVPDGKSGPLVIDPEVIFSTWSGATSANWATCAADGPDGSLFSGGISFSPGYPTTAGAYQINFIGGAWDMVITKFAPDGSTRLFSTYLGGSMHRDSPMEFIINDQEEVLVLGLTASQDYPTTTGAFDPTWNGLDDFVLTRLNAAGNTILQSTFVGGQSNDGLVAVNIFDSGERVDMTTDPDGFVYVTGATQSFNFPTTPGVFQPTIVNGREAVVFKLSPDLSTMVWSTYLGGNVSDLGYGIAVDDQRTVFVCGGTSSANFPTTSGAYQEFHAGNWDGFIVRFNQNGTNLLASTLLGTSTYDQALMADLDLAGNIYVTGQTMGNNFPFTPNTFSVASGKNFISKFDPNLSTLLSGSVIGSGREYPDLTPTAFNVDSCGRIFYAAWASRIRYHLPKLPITDDALQSETDTRNLYFMILSADMEDLFYATFFGGKKSMEHTHARSATFDREGRLYHNVCTGCRLAQMAGIPPQPGQGGITVIHADFWNLFPITDNAIEPQNLSGSCSIASFKIDFEYWEVLADFRVEPDSEACRFEPIAFVDSSFGGYYFDWDFGDGSTASGDSVGHAWTNAGVFTVTEFVEDSTKCINRDTMMRQVTILPAPTVEAGPDTFSCFGQGVRLLASASGNWVWSPSGGLSDTSALRPLADPAGPTLYTLQAIGPNGCAGEDSVFVDVVFLDAGFFPEPETTEVGRPVNFYDNSTGAITHLYDFGDGNLDSVPSPVHAYTADGVYEVLQTVTSPEGCVDRARARILVETLPRIFVPNAFSPNGDGLNDRFTISFANVNSLNFSIFDRFGNLIYRSTAGGPDWDGRFRGNPVQEGTYTWLMDGVGVEGEVFRKSGTLHLIR